MIRETLDGDNWTREQRDIDHNEGRFPERRWEMDRTAQRRDSTAGQPGNGIVLIDITDDADPPTSQAN